MADIVVEINGEQTTLTDNGDGTFSIDLGSREARRFLRGERDQINDRLAILRRERDEIDLQRNALLIQRNTIRAEIDLLIVNKDEITAFLQGQGDE